jgi:hypothetical protein
MLFPTSAPAARNTHTHTHMRNVQDMGNGRKMKLSEVVQGFGDVMVICESNGKQRVVARVDRARALLSFHAYTQFFSTLTSCIFVYKHGLLCFARANVQEKQTSSFEVHGLFFDDRLSALRRIPIAGQLWQISIILILMCVPSVVAAAADDAGPENEEASRHHLNEDVGHVPSGLQHSSASPDSAGVSADVMVGSRFGKVPLVHEHRSQSMPAAAAMSCHLEGSSTSSVSQSHGAPVSDPVIITEIIDFVKKKRDGVSATKIKETVTQILLDKVRFRGSFLCRTAFKVPEFRSFFFAFS